MDIERYVFGFMDLETTGHDPLKRVGDILIPWHEIIEIGVVVVDQPNLEELGEFNQKVKPEHPERCLPGLVNDYPVRAERGEWNDAYCLSETLEKLFHFFGQWEATIILAGHNFFFDWNFLQTAFAWCSVLEDKWRKYIHYSRLDTRSMGVQELLGPDEIYYPSKFSIRSGRISEQLGIEPEPHPHKALNGARQALEIYKKLYELKRFSKGGQK